jgi:hypothetical protein
MKKLLLSVMLAVCGMAATANDRIKLIVPLAVGGTYDQAARGLSDYLNKQGFNTYVENIPGAGHMVAYNRFTQDPGRQLILTGDTFFVNAVLGRIRTEEFQPVGYLGDNAQFMYTSPAKGLTCANIRTRPVFLGTSGKNSTSDIMTRTIQNHIGNSVSVVYYKGQNDAIRDAMAGHIDGALAGQSAASERLVALFNTTDQTVNGVPSMRECLGLAESLKATYLVFANNEWRDTTAISRAIVAYVNSDAFATASQTLGIDRGRADVNRQVSQGLARYRRLQTRIDFTAE